MANIVLSICASALVAATPILYACLGELFSQRAGVMNLGLEGIMLLGAVFGYMTLVNTNSLIVSLLVVAAVGLIVGFIYALVTVTLQANQIVSGLAMVGLGTGISGFMGTSIASKAAATSFVKISIPGLSEIPILGTIFFKQDLMVYALYILVPLFFIYIYKTRPGLKLRSLGESPGTLDAVGARVYGMQYLYVMVGCMLVAIGGAYVTLAYTPSWADSMTAGRGWIAAALVIFGTWNPALCALGALLFGGISVISLSLQAAGIQVPAYFVNMLPYVCTILVLIFATGNFRKKRSLAPAALGTFYDREAR